MKTAYVTTNGCLSAQTDAANLNTSLARGGYFLTDKLSAADLIVLSLCGVTDFSANTRSLEVYQQAQAQRKPGSMLVVSGCLPGMDEKVKDIMPKADHYVPISKINDLDTILGISDDLQPAQYQAKGRLYIKVANGCLDKCAYCAIPNARGKLKSADGQQIVQTAQKYAREHEDPTIVLVGEDVGAFGRDQRYTIIDLLSSLFNSDVPFKTKIDVINPWWFLKYPSLVDVLAEGTAEGKFVPSFGLPMQSASNKVLRDMRRPYTIEEYTKILLDLNQIPRFSPTTDIIVGFPTESDGDFNQTQEFLSQHSFAYYGVWAFSPRPNTAAALLKQLDEETIKRRQEEIVTQVVGQIASLSGLTPEELLNNLSQSGEKLPISVNAQSALGDLVTSSGVVLYDDRGAIRYEPVDSSGSVSYEM